uniref:Uncharacterized protein n=1 Tax=Rhizophora mucronata TaxID=61149 RepID=A0A2P2J0N3_RHIMU
MEPSLNFRANVERPSLFSPVPFLQAKVIPRLSILVSFMSG